MSLRIDPFVSRRSELARRSRRPDVDPDAEAPGLTLGDRLRDAPVATHRPRWRLPKEEHVDVCDEAPPGWAEP